MASIRKRRTATGELRYDVRYRVQGRLVEQTFKRRRDADNRVRQVEADELTGGLIDPALGRQTLASYAATWLEARLVRGRPLAAMTRQGYQGLLRRNILPALGSVPIASITTDVVRSWYSGVITATSADQAAKSYRLLRAILNTAAEDSRISRNPCRLRGAGIERTSERPMVDTELVFALADAIDPRLRALVLLAAFAGLRTGELLGLRRRDVDLLHSVIHVRVQAQEVATHGRLLSGPKSEAGQRTVVVPKALHGAIEEHLDRFAQLGLDGAIFTGHQGKPITRSRLSAAWRQACRAAHAPAGLRVHDLRHHAATLAARMPGITTKELMARIGHSSPRAALIYQHAANERDRTIADFLDQAIAATPSRPATHPLDLHRRQ
jgi:integrase